MLLIPKLGLGYQNIPKIATTSIFAWLYQAHGETPNDDPIIQNHNRNFFLRQFKVDSLEEVRRAEGGYLRFALVRDPVLRFLSMYGNRVVAKGKLGRASRDAERVLSAGLPLNPQLNDLINSLDGYLAASRAVAHHARRQSELLGPDLTVYDYLLNISEADRLPPLIRQHWRTHGMYEALANADEHFPRLQTDGPKIGLEGLSRRSFDRLLEHYQSDYEAIPALDQDAIKARFVAENGGSNLFFHDFSEPGTLRQGLVKRAQEIRKLFSQVARKLTRIGRWRSRT